jgi:hypothetical protein
MFFPIIKSKPQDSWKIAQAAINNKETNKIILSTKAQYKDVPKLQLKVGDNIIKCYIGS